MAYEDTGYSVTKTAAIAIPTAIVLIALIIAAAVGVTRNSLANTAKDRELGNQCIAAGGSWVKSDAGYQCIAGK